MANLKGVWAWNKLRGAIYPGEWVKKRWKLVPCPKV